MFNFFIIIINKLKIFFSKITKSYFFKAHFTFILLIFSEIFILINNYKSNNFFPNFYINYYYKSNHFKDSKFNIRK